jgi:hypothetical protein
MNMKERRTLGWLRQLIRDWQDRLFASDDEAARQRGWQITRGPGGHGRSYRDPRWDQISACSQCDGTGAAGARRCENCDGRGTVRLDWASVTDWDPR